MAFFFGIAWKVNTNLIVPFNLTKKTAIVCTKIFFGIVSNVEMINIVHTYLEPMVIYP